MSAAEPADPLTPRMNAGGAGAVIDITRRRRGALETAQGRWKTMTPPDSSLPGIPQPDQTPLRLLAEDIEKSLNAVGQTLTDDDTAATYRRTLQICSRLLEGMLATGVIDQKQLEELLAALQGMEQAPRLV